MTTSKSKKLYATNIYVYGSHSSLGKLLCTHIEEYGFKKMTYREHSYGIMISVYQLINEKRDVDIFIVAHSEINPIGMFPAIVNSMEKFRVALDQNLILPIRILKERFCGNKKCIILNLNSGVVDNPHEGWFIYNMTKSALHSFFLTLEKTCHTLRYISYMVPACKTNMQKIIKESQFPLKTKTLKDPKVVASDIFKELKTTMLGMLK